MSIKDWVFGKQKEVEEFSPILVRDEFEVAEKNIRKIEEQFKGEVKQEKKKFPVDLGEEHPFDFSQLEELYKKFGFLTAVIDKYVDFVVGPGFYIECEDERAKKIIEDFMRDVEMSTLLRAWIKEGLLKGNGFLEIGGDLNELIAGLKVLNANYMYVDRDEFGVVQGYNQYRGAFDKFAKTKITSFKSHQIAHFGFNMIGDNAYGLGIAYSALVTINNLLQNEKDVHMLMSRKANSPYDVSMGGVIGGKYYKPNVSDVTAIGKSLEYLHNKHEWVHDGLTTIKVLDFGNIGEKFNMILEHDVGMLFYIFQIPPELMGMANIPEGMAEVRIDAFERRIQSIQEEVEKVIEQKIFKRVLNANGFDMHVEFQWGRPSNNDKIERLNIIKNFMIVPTLSQSAFKLMEKDVIKMLDYDENEYETMSEEEERRREEERPQPIVPGENEKKPQFPIPEKKFVIPKKERYELKESCKHTQESWDNINDIQEWLGFNYKDYVKQISVFIKSDDFTNLKAENDIEEQAGYLSQQQINELKRALNRGFVEGKGIREIARDIDVKVKPNDLYEITTEDKIGNLIRGKDVRSIGIARTEITRVANEGAIQQFKEGGITKIRWVASSGTRTCEICEGLNGQIFDINNHPEIPVHTMCRCTTIPLTELS